MRGLNEPAVHRLSIRYLIISILYMGWLFFLSSLPGSATGPNTPFWRFLSNAAHIPLFGGLGICLAMMLEDWAWLPRALGTLGIGLVYSVFDEFHQSFVPGRTMSVSDMGLDFIGLAGSLWMMWCISRYRRILPLSLRRAKDDE